MGSLTLIWKLALDKEISEFKPGELCWNKLTIYRILAHTEGEGKCTEAEGFLHLIHVGHTPLG